ncbi:mechanosensitive channel MscK [uncultured Actinobacillus sp.]|uniref:mechanosensitive channel MscK n=1 Tax=uncultured Actinobacillus sp. TaxID=417616 RepID=UPI0025CC38E0|nr:mechanosensitive channel MscK [uncultured Actinobacillus sp.]
MRTIFLLLSLIFAVSITAVAADLPSVKTIQTELDKAKKAEQSDSNKAIVKNYEDTLALLDSITKQKNETDALNKAIANAPAQLKASQENLERLKKREKSPEQLQAELTKLALNELQEKLLETQDALLKIQENLTALNGQLSSQKSLPERVQAALTANATRTQEINTALTATTSTPSLKTKLQVELEYLGANNAYNQLALSANDQLTSLYASQVDEKNLAQSQAQQELAALQTVINNQKLAESQNQAKQATEVQQNAETTNPSIQRELAFNTRISESLVEQTTQLNALSQDNLRIKTALDNLQQTQRTIEEQISALQGTLVLSRIINKQKQLLPQDEMVKGLSKQISDLRVKIFDVTEFKDKLTDIDAYITNLEKSDKVTFTTKEKSQLTSILQERNKMLTDSVKMMNDQLNLAINIELNQQQVQTISDTLQSKLQQQSFWVKSNDEMSLKWVEDLPARVGWQIRIIANQFDFSNWRDNLPLAIFLVGGLLVLTWLISRQKEKIKKRLTDINNQMKSLETESQWHTPTAIFWTLILSLPTTFIFLAVFIVITYICFQEPTTVWRWGLQMAGYWWYFAFMMALLRPNGIAYRHFKMPKESNENFRRILKKSGWILALMLNASIFTHLESGVAYDIIGQLMAVGMLLLMIFMVTPEMRKAIEKYQGVAKKSSFMLSILRIILLFVPIALIILILSGYYYTALVLIEHFVATYFAITTWIILRALVYRGFEVSARRLAAKRLREKREQLQAKVEAEKDADKDESAVEIVKELQHQNESLTINDVKAQVLRMVDFVLWIGLFVMLYWVWADLLTVAFYLDGITLWQQSVTTDAGTTMEAVTLLNLLIAIIILTVTVVLVRNIGGVLEVLVFSNVKLSQGTPYTITTLLTYGIIALGGMFAFGSLGMSWSKLQWLFAALSVGLGFGMQEIFANFVSGIIILFERPVRIGDQVTIGEFTGTISKIQIRATTLLDFDKKEVIVPNKAFVTERIVNWALTSSMTRLVIRVGVAYGSDLELTKRLLLQAAAENEKVLKDPAPAAYFLTFGASTLDHELRVYVGQISDRTRTIDALNRRINELFAEHNIEIAFNQLDVFIKNTVTQEEFKVGSEKLA